MIESNEKQPQLPDWADTWLESDDGPVPAKSVYQDFGCECYVDEHGEIMDMRGLREPKSVATKQSLILIGLVVVIIAMVFIFRA